MTRWSWRGDSYKLPIGKVEYYIKFLIKFQKGEPPSVAEIVTKAVNDDEEGYTSDMLGECAVRQGPIPYEGVTTYKVKWSQSL